jgi:hypothetical protein
MTVPELAKRLYERFGSWSKAARALNVSGTALYAWRDGRAIPGFQYAGVIAGALSLPRDEVRDILIRAHEERDTRGTPMTHSVPRRPPVMVRTPRLPRVALAAR